MIKYDVRINGQKKAEFRRLSEVSNYLSSIWLHGLVLSVVKTLNGIIIDNYI